MKSRILITLLLMIPLTIFGQTYSALWKQAADAEKKDLPKTQLEALRQIVEKAEREKAYGQLLKAELKAAQVEASVAPDSLKPAVERLQQRCDATKDIVLKTVYQTALWQIYQNANRSLEPRLFAARGTQELSNCQINKPVLSPELCQQLAQVKDETYKPFVATGSDSRLFGHDLLSIVGYALRDFKPLSDYYDAVGNRPAACLTALEHLKVISNHIPEQSSPTRGLSPLNSHLSSLDSLISRYEDLPEAGEVAVERYNAMSRMPKTTVAERVGYARWAIGKWGSNTQLNALRNAVSELTAPMFSLAVDHGIALPQRSQTVVIDEVRHLSSLQMKVFAVKGRGDLNLNPMDADDYKRLKPLLTELRDASVSHAFTGQHADYEVFSDSLTLAALPVGVYMLEFTSQPSTRTIRRMYYVTDVFTMAEEQPDGRIRYVVVSATTGQPIAKARLRIKEYISWKNYKTHNLVADAKGECFLEETEGRRREVFAYTATDDASPEMNLSTRYNYYEGHQQVEQTCLFTDRAIYRPGQTVRVSALVYEVRHGFEHATLENRTVTFSLRDANYKEVQTQRAQTDKYGTCAVSFTLPASGLTGQFTIRANGQSCSFRVEEYKRPTFEVSFDEVKQHYEAGDTVEAKAVARSYAGVPVQGAKVSYKVMRRMAFWWWSYSRYWDLGLLGNTSSDEEVASGETTTADDGSFTVAMPLTMPESRHPLFYNFVVTADVTDQAGETRTGSYSLPLGNRKTAFSVDLGEKILAEGDATMTFHLRNAAGNDLDAEVRYRFDAGQWQTAPANSQFSILNYQLKSGSHSLEAICGEDTLKRDFIVFSLDDKRPAAKTDDWFWVSDTQFPSDGKPVTVQVGSSAPDVHIVYSIFSGQKCIEQGAVDRSNELINRKLKYKEEWGDGILLTFAWVKENRCYTHQTTIRRPLPDKQLKLTWNTFRDRLTPGQQEEWTLTVMGPDGKPADAQLMAVLYDKSLDQLVSHNWLMIPYTSLSLPYASWAAAVRSSLSLSAVADWKYMTVPTYHFSHFDESVYPTAYSYATRGFRGRNALGARALAKHAVVESAMAMAEPALMNDEVLGYGVMKAKETVAEPDAEESASGGDTGAEPVVQLRENLNETAFFYPQLMTDANGVIALKFTLPESLTTWRFMGLAHTTDLCHGMLSGETVAKKDVMIQPNVPRFVRQGDEAVVSARIFNTSDHAVSGKAMLRLLDPETEAVVYETSQPFSVAVDGTASVAFNCNLSPLTSHPLPLLICQVLATGDGFSDGEQHYLPILPNTEHVTVTLPFTQIEPGTKTIDLAALLPEGSTQQKLTVEYTNHPAWLMIQALPALGTPSDENAISQAASLYANSLGRHIISQAPDAKKAFELWKQEETSSNPSSLTSNLSKNQELKDLLLAETPWVLDAERETEQKQRLADFFDDNTMQLRLSSAIEKLKKLQQSNGAWTWWPGMPGSFYITVAVSEMLVRLNAMAGQQDETAQMLTKAFDYMGLEMVEEVNQMKRNAKKGIHPTFPSFKALQWLYLSTLDGRRLPSSVEEANKYLLNLLKKDIKRQTMYEKAMTAVILAQSPLLADADRQRAREYVQSLKEYTVYREEMGRYYDTPRAGYSWYDYKIPTQTMAIEALQRITPDDRQTIQQMQRWLLQSKRTQAWDTPINSVNAVYAFLNGNGRSLGLDAPLADIKVDGQSLDAPKATAAIGYVKAPVSAESKTLTIEKTADDTSWGAVYAQFMQPARDIQDTGAGLTVKREYLTSEGGSQFSILNSCVPAVASEQSSSAQFSTLSVGSRLKVRITITADRDYDFVQLIDRRAACLEPVSQLSGYHDGSYCTPRDNATNYYFDRLSKGTHVIETEYYIDRPGTYETGSCSVSCAYAPEFRGITSSQTINVK